MKYSIEINKIIEGALKLDNVKVQNYSKLLIEKLKEDGEDRAAKKLMKTLYANESSALNPMSIEKKFKMPIDSESRVPMADTIYPQDIDETVILSDQNYYELETFLLSYKNADRLNALGVGFSNTLLMYGPPGCGKTKSAYFIAKELNLPLIIARLDSMISSYLGTTSKNIRTLFEYVQKIPCVLFLDEFDAIAKARNDSNELGELKRVVNSLLQNIDTMSENSLLLAATNHEDLLDKAVWRRFDYRLKIGLPDRNAREKLIDIFLGDKFNIIKKDKEALVCACHGLSGADIEEIIKKSIRKSIIFDYNLEINNIFNEIFDYRNVCEDVGDNSKDIVKTKAKFLRNIDEKVFSYAVISKVLGVSKTQISNVLKSQ